MFLDKHRYCIVFKMHIFLICWFLPADANVWTEASTVIEEKKIFKKVCKKELDLLLAGFSKHGL
jgi:hypothetical protein